jgi:hypothetical protein
MTTTRRVCSVVLAYMLLEGCGGGSPDEGGQREPPPVEETVFGDAVGTMERARGVEDTTLQHKQDLDRAIDQQDAGEQ